jgi:Fe2+ or Zn2+ uptake regulation protein
VDACGLEDSLRHLESISGFKITRHKLMLFGFCATCQPETEEHRVKTGL